jgi:transposase-like protein
MTSPTEIDVNLLKEEATASATTAREATESRNQAIVALHANGVGYREIGRLVGLSHVAALKIIRRYAEAAETAA